MGAAMGAAMGIGDIDAVKAATEDIAKKEAVAKANDAKYGPSYSGRFVDDYNGWDPQFNSDPKALERMGYDSFGAAAGDAASTIFNGARDAVQNAANHFPKIPNPFAPAPNTSNPGPQGPGSSEPSTAPYNPAHQPYGPEYQPYPPEGSAAPNSRSNRQNKFTDDPPVRPPGADPKRYPDVPPGDPIAILERPPSPPPIGSPQPLGTAQQYDIKVFPRNAPSLIYYQRRVIGPITYARLPNDGTPGPYYTDDNGQVQQSTMYSFSLSWPGGSTVHTGGNTVWSATPVSPPAPGENPGWQPTPSDPQAWPSTPPAPHIPASPSPSAPPVVGPQPSASPQASPKNKPQSPTAPGEPAPNIPDPPGFPDFMPQGLPSPQGSPGLPSPNLGPANPLTSGSPSSDPVSLPNFPSPTTSTSTKESNQPRDRFDGTPPPTPAPPTEPNCKDPCIQGLKDAVKKQQELVSIQIKVFTKCKAQPTENELADYENKTIKVPKDMADFVGQQFDEIFKTASQTCRKQDASLALPDSFQHRLDTRPQLVVVYASTDKNSTSKWSLSIPNYNGSKNPRFLSYTKGNIMGQLRLKDGSRLVVFCKTAAIAKRVLNNLVRYVDPRFATRDIRIGEHFGPERVAAKVRPIFCTFYSTGNKKIEADWRIDFRKN